MDEHQNGTDEKAMSTTTMVDGNVPQIEKRKVMRFSGNVIRLACDLMSAKIISSLDRVTEAFIEAPEVQRVLSMTTPSVRELEALEDALKRAVLEERTLITSRLNKAHGILSVVNEQHDDATMAATIMRRAAATDDHSFFNTIPVTMLTNRHIREDGKRAIRQQKKAAKKRKGKR